MLELIDNPYFDFETGGILSAGEIYKRQHQLKNSRPIDPWSDSTGRSTPPAEWKDNKKKWYYILKAVE